MSSSTDTGHKAEKAAANYLEMRGFKILEMNWRRPHCETDIIAQKDGAVYFVEVKYRKNDTQGNGLDYVTDAKLGRMQRAAESWIVETKWQGKCRLSVVEVSGPTFMVEHFIDSI
jgi:putative endonuclease